jgi:hypothetical protein
MIKILILLQYNITQHLIHYWFIIKIYVIQFKNSLYLKNITGFKHLYNKNFNKIIILLFRAVYFRVKSTIVRSRITEQE